MDAETAGRLDDIGAVDGVVLVHPPGGAVRLLQRAGRSGHAPGRPRRALLLTANPAELLEAAVTAASSRSAQYELLQLPAYPLDVLCQQLVGMAAQRRWSASAAFDLMRRAYPYRDLPAAEFENCLAYLCGRDRNDNAWLPARLRRECDGFTIADDRTARVLRRNIGTIITEEPRPVRLCEPVPLRPSWRRFPAWRCTGAGWPMCRRLPRAGRRRTRGRGRSSTARPRPCNACTPP